jgi:hypothetical protein
MKYRIIKEFDDNGLRHFELEIWKKNIFGKYRWKPVTEQHFRATYIKRFKTMTDVENYLRALNVRREIVETNEVDVTNV